MLTEVLKDYLAHAEELVNLEGAGFFTVIKATITYGFQSLVLAFVYIVTFQWVTDFMEIPAVFKHHTMLILDGKNVLYSSLDVDLTSPFGSTRLNNKGLITGIMNSFFLMAPVSVAQLLCLRHLIIMGWRRAAVASAGVITAHALFLGLVLFGWEGMLIPWFYLEPVTILLGVYVVCDCINHMDHKLHIYMERDRYRYDTSLYPLTFRQTFVLTSVESMSIFQHFGGVSVHGGLMETSLGTQFYLLSTVAYWFGLIFGSVLSGVIWGWIVLKIRPPLSLDAKDRIHSVFMLLICTMAIHTFPYYALDYLAASPLGYIYLDRSLHAAQPRSGHIVRQAEFWDDDFDWDFNVSTSSFDDDYSVSEEHVYEFSTFAAEQSWKNREDTRERLVESDNERFPGILWKDFDRSKFRSPIYQTPEHNIEGIFDPNTDPDPIDDRIDGLQDIVFVEPDGFGDADITSQGEETYDYDMDCQRRFLDLYYTNPIYKQFLKADTLSFLTGQSKTSNLLTEDEFDLYQRRFILQRYLDFASNFQSDSQRPQHSFATRVYNQQFKGTMSVIRQFTAVRVIFPDVDARHSTESTPDTKELKFDQPLYNRYHDEYQDWLHEELRPDISPGLWRALQDRGRADQNELKNDLANELPTPTTKGDKINPKLARQLRYMTLNQPGPFYIGWDAHLHKMVLKGSQLPNTLTAGNQSFPPDSESTTLDKDLSKDNHVTFEFQAWPTWPEEPERAWLQQLHLPNLMINDDQMEEFMYVLKLRYNVFDPLMDFQVQEEEDESESSARTQQGDKELQVTLLNDFLARITNFDWNEQILDLFEEQDGGPLAAYFQFGHVLPPQMDGVAWPSSIGNKQIQKNKDFHVPGYPLEWRQGKK